MYQPRETPRHIGMLGCGCGLLCSFFFSEVLGFKEWEFVGMMHDKPETKKDLVLSQRANVKFMSKILDRLREDDD